jgi:hypothetical protein
MNVAVALLTLALLAVVILVISAPLRRARRAQPEPAERGELEAARLAKYREIRDAELDYRTGKLSREDHERVAAALRAQAAEILARLEALGGEVAEIAADEPTARAAGPPPARSAQARSQATACAERREGASAERGAREVPPRDAV